MNTHTNKVELQKWNHTGADGKSHNMTNIIARLYPNQDRRIILATHYDSKKLADKDLLNKDEPVLGANDSASGVAVLVELAKVLGNSHTIPIVGVDIIFFDGEEGNENQGGDYSDWEPIGSTYFAEHLSEFYSDINPEQAIVIDMVCDKDLKIYKEESSVHYASTQVDQFWNIAKSKDSHEFQDQVGGIIKDDHTPLNNIGIPSFLVIDIEYPYFHTTNDTLDKCSSQSLEAVANTIFSYVYSIR